jgi:hypothetical protein
MLVAGKAQLLGALFAVLAGLWMTATHVPLLAQSDQVGLDAALWMFVPSVALFAAAIGVAIIAWTKENAQSQPTGAFPATRPSDSGAGR